MFYKKFGDDIVIRLEIGEDVVTSVAKVCDVEKVKLGSVTGLGAVDHVVVGLYKVAEKKYYSNTFDGEMEMSSLVGNVTTKEGNTYLHFHATFAGADGKVIGGHLNEAKVSATAEIFLHIIHGEVDRIVDDHTGLNVIKM